MRKTILVTVLIIVLMLAACGNSKETKSLEEPLEIEPTTVEEANEEPLDLTGNWVQEGKEFEDSYQAGYISGDRIEIFWISDGGKSYSLYWSGTYKASLIGKSEYTWDSNNDKTQTDSALLASGDDQKPFTYKDGKISYEVSAMGKTTTVKLVPTETDYMSKGTAIKSADTSNLKEVVLTKSAYTISHNDGMTTIYYFVYITNPNAEYAIEFPKILVTAKDKNGKILKTEEMVLSGIAAGDEYNYGNTVSYEGKAPEVVEISVGNSEDDYVSQSSSGIIKSSDLSVSNTSVNTGTLNTTFTGEVTNNSTEDLDNVAMIVFYQSGKSACVATAYVDDLKSGDTKPFEISAYTDLTDIDSYDIYALQWQ
jgi:uncharacterized lipoprotein YehR (DUF1307 family)